MKEFKFIILAMLISCSLSSSAQIIKRGQWLDAIHLSDSNDYEVMLLDGSEFIGQVISFDSSTVVIRTSVFPKLELPVNKITEMTRIEKGSMVDGEYWFPNPNPTRYLFGPSGFSLKQGEGYYQSTYAVLNSVNYGITDHFTLGGGVELVSTLSGYPTAFVSPKLAYPITDQLNVGIGAIAAFSTDLDPSGIAYGVATYGSRDKHITLGIGTGAFDGEYFNAPIVTLSAMIRVSRRAAMITENWLIADEYLDGVVSYGMRFFGKRMAIDIAFINNAAIAEELIIGIPYIDFALQF